MLPATAVLVIFRIHPGKLLKVGNKMRLIIIPGQVGHVCEAPGRLPGNQLFGSFKTGNSQKAADADPDISFEVPLYLPFT